MNLCFILPCACTGNFSSCSNSFRVWSRLGKKDTNACKDEAPTEHRQHLALGLFCCPSLRIRSELHHQVLEGWDGSSTKQSVMDSTLCFLSQAYGVESVRKQTGTVL
eukprot:753073-Amphidinium_carterae.2